MRRSVKSEVTITDAFEDIRTSKMVQTLIRNTQQNVTVFITPDNSFKFLSDIIKRANKSIDIMVYEFWSTDIFNVIEEVVRSKNVDVRVLIEGNVYGTAGDEYNRWMAYKFWNLSQEGFNVTVMWDVDSYYMHAKVIIIDESIVLVASENFVPTAYPLDPTNIKKIVYDTGSRGWGAVIFNSTVAEEFAEVFEQEWINASPYDPSEQGTEPPDYGIIEYEAPFQDLLISDPNAVVTPIFSPTNSYDAILQAINSAQYFILLELMYISNRSESVDSLLDALRDAKERGVTVQIILEDDVSYYYDIVDNLTALGFYVVPAFRDADVPLFCHNKGIIIDDELAIIGSINWSGTSLTKNTEAGVLIKSDLIAKTLKQVYAWDWEKSSGETFDSDNDGLSNAYELDHDLDPNNPDTDGDGLSDYDEIFVYHTDPNDATSPGVVIVSPENNSCISSTSLTVEWTASELVDTCHIYLNDTYVDRVPAQAGSYTIENLRDQSWYILKIIAELTTGSNVTVKLLFGVDTLAPELEVLSPENNTYLIEGEYVISWTASDFSSIRFRVEINGSTIYEGKNTQMSWEFEKGDYTITITAIDAAGNSASEILLIHIRERPKLAIVYPLNGTYINDAVIELTWNVSDDSVIKEFIIKLNDTTIITLPKHTRSYQISLEDEKYYIALIIAIDALDNVIAVSYSIFGVDTQPPVITIEKPANNSVIYTNEIELSWHAEDFSPVRFIITVNGSVVYEGYENEITVSMSPGTNVIIITAIDAAGNKNSILMIIHMKEEKREINEYIILGIIIVLIALVLVILVRKYF